MRSAAAAAAAAALLSSQRAEGFTPSGGATGGARRGWAIKLRKRPRQQSLRPLDGRVGREDDDRPLPPTGIRTGGGASSCRMGGGSRKSLSMRAGAKEEGGETAAIQGDGGRGGRGKQQGERGDGAGRPPPPVAEELRVILRHMDAARGKAIRQPAFQLLQLLLREREGREKLLLTPKQLGGAVAAAAVHGQWSEGWSLIRNCGRFGVEKSDESLSRMTRCLAKEGCWRETMDILNYMDRELADGASILSHDNLLFAMVRGGEHQRAVEHFEAHLDTDYITKSDKRYGWRVLLPTVFSYTQYIGALAHLGQPRKAITALETLKGWGLQTDAFVYTSTITACANAKWWEEGLALLQQAKADKNVMVDTCLYTATIWACAGVGKWREAEALLEEMRRGGQKQGIVPTERTIAAAVSAYTKEGRLSQALILIQKSRAWGIRPTAEIYTAAITCCKTGGKLDEGLYLLSDMWNRRVPRSVATYNTAMDLCYRCGDWQRGLGLLRKLEEEWALTPDTFTLNSAIMLCDLKHDFPLAIQCLQRLTGEGSGGPAAKVAVAQQESSVALAGGQVERGGKGEGGGGGGEGGGAGRGTSAAAKGNGDNVRGWPAPQGKRWAAKPDALTYALLIGVCGSKRGKYWSKAMELYRDMQKPEHGGIRPVFLTFAKLMDVMKSAGQWVQVLSLYADMQAFGIQPNEQLYQYIMTACIQERSWRWAVLVNAEVERRFWGNLEICGKAMTAHLMMQEVAEAKLLLKSAEDRWGATEALKEANAAGAATVQALADAGLYKEAGYVQRVLATELGVLPDGKMWTEVAQVQVAQGNADEALALLQGASTNVKDNDASSLCLEIAKLYMDRGEWGKVSKMLTGLKGCGASTYASIMTESVSQGRSNVALRLKEEMNMKRLPMSERCLCIVVTAYGNLGRWQEGLELLYEALHSQADDAAGRGGGNGLVADGTVGKEDATAAAGGDGGESDGTQTAAATVSPTAADAGAAAFLPRVTASAFNAALLVCSKRELLYPGLGLLRDMWESNIKREVRTYNLVMALCKACGEWERVANLLEMMREDPSGPNGRPLVPDVVSYNTAISACKSQGNLCRAYELLAKMRRERAYPDLYTFNTLMALHADRGDVDGAQALLEDMQLAEGVQPDAVSYHTLIGAAANAHRPEVCVKWLENMEREGITPTGRSYAAAIRGCGSAHWSTALELLNRASASGVAHLHTYNAAMVTLSKNGNVDAALRLLEELREKGFTPDLVTHGAVVWACVNAGQPAKALDFFCSFLKDEAAIAGQEDGTDTITKGGTSTTTSEQEWLLRGAEGGAVPLPALAQHQDVRQYAYAGALAACKEGNVSGDVVEAVLRAMRDRSVPPSVSIYNTALDMLVQQQQLVMQQQRENANANANNNNNKRREDPHNYAVRAVRILDQMGELGLQPTVRTFNCVIAVAVTEPREWKEGLNLLQRMVKEELLPSRASTAHVLRMLAEAEGLDKAMDALEQLALVFAPLDQDKDQRQPLFNALLSSYHEAGMYDEEDMVYQRALRAEAVRLWSVEESSDSESVIDLHGYTSSMAHAAVRAALSDMSSSSLSSSVQSAVGRGGITTAVGDAAAVGAAGTAVGGTTVAAAAAGGGSGAGMGASDTDANTSPPLTQPRNLVIITGVGKGSERKYEPVLRPEVQRMLMEEFYPPISSTTVPGNAGRIVVHASVIAPWVRQNAKHLTSDLTSI